MGQTMACCGGKSEIDTNDIQTNAFSGKSISFKDKVELIIRIQKIWRGYLTRKRF
jgi:hypothetical protein